MYLDPTNDLAFVRIFGNENKKNILISFLNNVMELVGNKTIKEITLLNPSQTPQIKNLKKTIVDIRCKDERGISYIVEMQVLKVKAFAKRIQYYTAKAYSNQIEKAEDYPKLNSVVFLGILDFELFQNSNYLTKHLIIDPETMENALKDLSFYFVELPKFNKRIEELETVEEKWIYFMKNAGTLSEVPVNMKEEELVEAFELLDKVNWTKEELEVYDRISMEIQDEKGVAEQAMDEGMEKGIEIGRVEGIKEGIKEGIRDILEIKFEDEGLKLFEEIKRINELDKLEELKAKIKKARSVEGLRETIWKK